MQQQIEEYRKALMNMYRKYRATQPSAVPANAPIDNVEKNPQDHNATGKLQIIVSSAEGYFRVPNAEVTVFSDDIDQPKILYTLKTDESGQTTAVELKTKEKQFSESANADKTPYLTYNIRVLADGYVEQFHLNIPVFSGVTTLQKAELTGIGAYGDRIGPIIVDEKYDYNL